MSDPNDHKEMMAQARRDRRLIILGLPPEAADCPPLPCAFGETGAVAADVPQDAAVIAVGVDQATGMTLFKLCHPAFSQVETGAEIPRFCLPAEVR